MAGWQRAKKLDAFTVVVETGAAGYSAGWCLELPGCYAVVPPGADVRERMHLAILEFGAWAHNRAADRLTLEPGQIAIAQVVDTGEDIAAGDTSAFFLAEAEPASGREFPVWADAHDRAVDEIRDLAMSLPPALQEDRLDTDGRTLLRIVGHAAEVERLYASYLRDGVSPPRPAPGLNATLDALRDSHMLLQQVTCDVPPGMRVRRESSPVRGAEEWSVRKVMRRSVWHLRYHSWELRRALSSLWLA